VRRLIRYARGRAWLAAIALALYLWTFVVLMKPVYGITGITSASRPATTAKSPLRLYASRNVRINAVAGTVYWPVLKAASIVWPVQFQWDASSFTSDREPLVIRALRG